METNICEENVSLSAANVIDQKVGDNIDPPESCNVNDVTVAIVEQFADNETEQTFAKSDDTSQHGDNSLSNNEDNDYYEVVSAEGSVGGDDVDTAANDIGTPDDVEVNLTNIGFAAVSSSSSIDRSRSEQCSFIDLPFVPKFEFPLDPSESENVSNYGAFHVNQFISDNIPRPDKNFTIPPPNYRPLLDINPSFDFVHGTILNPPPPVHNPTFFATDEKVSAASEKPCDVASSNVKVVGKKLKKRSQPLKKDPVVDWVDENGDPLPGAFDYVKPNEERDLSEENTRVEYVFSVKEKKDVPVDSDKSCVLNSGFLIGQNVLHKNVAGNLGVPLRLSLDPSGTSKNVDEDEEKKLYEASKSGPEYKAAVQVVTALSSTVNKIVPGDETSKKDRRTRFRRNRFTDIKKEDDQQDEPAEVKPQKSAEEAALENQAITEILKEVQRGAARAREVGALGWQKCPIPVTNKTFLRNTLVSTLREPYRPPSRFEKFHPGFKKNDDGGSYHKSRDDDRSSSSRSRSRSSSRSHSSSYSRSVSGSSYTDDDHSGSRDTGKHFSGRGRGSWSRGHEYYDDAWAAYAAQYGYPWYNPDALPLFYGPEGWPMDPYAAMYYADPQAWMEYAAYYGTSSFGSRRMGRGFRGRGRGFRGRGRGGYEGDFRGYNNIGAGSSREYSQPHSRSGRSRSWSRDLSRSRSRSRAGSGEMRGQSHSTSQDRTHQGKRHARSRDRSLQGDSGEKSASDAETREKKKKKKKKKKKQKHKKLKKSKHRQKSEDSNVGDKNAEKIVDDIAGTTEVSNVNDDKEKPEEGRVEAGDLVKKREVAKLEKRKEYSKYTGDGEDKKEETKKIKEKKYDSKVREYVSETGDKVRSKGDNKTVDEQLGSSKNDEHNVDAREDHEKAARKQKEKIMVHHRSGGNKYKESSSQDAEHKSKNEDLRTTKLEDKTGGRLADASNSKSQVDRKGDRTNDSRVNVTRDKVYVDSGSRKGSYDKQDVANRQRRFDSSRFEAESRLSVGKYKFCVDKDNFMYDKRDGSRNKEQRDTSGPNVDRKSESRERKCGRDGSQGRRVSQDSSKYHKRRDETHSDGSESHDKGRSNGDGGRKSKDSHTFKQDKGVAERNRRSESNDSSRKSKMLDSYKARKDITLSDARGEIHDGKRPREEDYRDGRSIRRGDKSGSCDKGDGYVQKIGREIRGENRSRSRDSQERVRKADCKYRDGRGESSLVTKVSKKVDNSSIRQTGTSGGNKYNENDATSDITQREEKGNDNKERNKFASRQRIMQTDNGEENCEKKTASLNKDLHHKRQRSTSSDRDKVDENLDKEQTTRIINVTTVGNVRQKSRNDSEKEENKKCEDRGDLEGKQKEKHVKSDEMHSVDKEMKGFKKHKARRNDDRRKEEKAAAVECRDDKILHLSTTEGKMQESRELCEDNSSPEKLKLKRVLKLKQVSKKGGATVNSTDIELKNQSSCRDSNDYADVNDMKKLPCVMDRGGIVNKDEIEGNTDKRPKDDGKGVKRIKKIIKKQVGAKKLKTSSVGEATEGGNVITEGGGETGDILKKQLQSENTLNKESEKITVENSLGVE
ncbi:hypothetical protein BsWGS_18151 [Bradybaena similaris]